MEYKLHKVQQIIYIYKKIHFNTIILDRINKFHFNRPCIKIHLVLVSMLFNTLSGERAAEVNPTSNIVSVRFRIYSTIIYIHKSNINNFLLT
jgi:hypothetical protein